MKQISVYLNEEVPDERLASVVFRSIGRNKTKFITLLIKTIFTDRKAFFSFLKTAAAQKKLDLSNEEIDQKILLIQKILKPQKDESISINSAITASNPERTPYRLMPRRVENAQGPETEKEPTTDPEKDSGQESSSPPDLFDGAQLSEEVRDNLMASLAYFDSMDSDDDN